MRHDNLLEPIDGGAPCGPDLDEIGDEDYLNYMLPAEDRLPSRFFDKDSGAPFDRSAIDLKSELATIGQLLDKSRDLRLLALEARFQILSGQILGFCDSILAMAGLIDRFWDSVHPQPYDGDYTMRQNALGALDDRIRVVLPLQFAPIVRDKRLGPVSYRAYAMATGAAQPREEEQVVDAGSIVNALGSEENRETTMETHAALSASREALKAIRDAFISGPGYAAAPGFDGLDEAMGDILALIGKAIPESSDLPDAAADDDIANESPGDTSTSSEATRPAAAVEIGSHAQASAALFAAEQYFSASEPSAPALILVHQARDLIGKPLVAALEALAPEAMEQMLIRFDGAYKFQFDIGRMRALTESAAAITVEPQEGVTVDREEASASSRAEAVNLLAGVEAYFRSAEPSSPVPVLLAKARGYMSRDFVSILKDLFPPNTDGE